MMSELNMSFVQQTNSATHSPPPQISNDITYRIKSAMVQFVTSHFCLNLISKCSPCPNVFIASEKNTFINIFGANLPLHWNFQRACCAIGWCMHDAIGDFSGANGWLHQKFWRTFGTNGSWKVKKMVKQANKVEKFETMVKWSTKYDFFRSKNFPTS